MTSTINYNFENRLWYINSGLTASFVYDADAGALWARVKSTVDGVTTIYIAGVFEFIENGATDKMTTYYDGNAMRRSGYGTDDGVFYLLQDHLKSSSVFVDQAGNTLATNYYYPYGGNRGGTAFSNLTTKRFTGQYHESTLPGGEGLSYYNARWYDPQLGRFLSADTIVPGAGNPQAFNRYSYVLNRPTGLVDPSGHEPIHHSNYPCSYTACVKDTMAGKWVPVPTWTPALHQRYYGSTRKPNTVARDPFDYLPTYVGAQIGVGGTGNVIVGGEMDFDVAGGCNVISLECSMFLVNAAGVRTATPELAAVNIHGGYTLAYHASSKASMLDASTFNSVDVQSDEIARVGISVSRSRGYNSRDVNNDGKFTFLGAQRSEPLTTPFIDPLFKHTVDATSVNLSLGVNVVPNVVDIGYVAGVSDTNEIGSVNLINLYLMFLKGRAFPVR